MIAVTIEPTFSAWRDKARELLKQRIHPEDVDWNDKPSQALLLGDCLREDFPASAVKVPTDFLKLAETVACHHDPRRWAILYRMVHRMTMGGERHLLTVSTDPDTRQTQLWAKAISRDIHKMHAFVRFCLTHTDEETGREHYVSWFEPEYRIVELASPFFRKRFTSMNWSILTPCRCAHWDGEELHFTEGLSRKDAPADDDLDSLWRTYYRSIFNPARIKARAMRSEMPKKYWHNLPEAQLIPDLIAKGNQRVSEMLDESPRPEKPLPKNAYIKKLHERMKNESSE